MAETRSARLVPAAAVLTTSGLLGLAVGLPISLVAHADRWQVRLPVACAGDFACDARFLFAQPVVVSALLLAGALFGLMAQRLAGTGTPWIAALGG
jgi:hypothetical protein